MRSAVFGLVLWNAGGAQAETFDAMALAARIAQTDPMGTGMPGEIVPVEEGYSLLIGLVAVVFFEDGPEEHPLKVSYWVFESPEKMLAATDDDLFVLANFNPAGEDFSDWKSYGYTGPGADAVREQFQCAYARDPATGLINANCAGIEDERQTLVFGGLTGRKTPDDMPSFVFMNMLSEMSMASKALTGAEQSLRMPSGGGVVDAAVIDPALVGNWETYVATGNGWSLFRLEITGAGRYAFLQDGVSGHSGRFEARDGQWRMTSETNGWVDFGNYQIPEPTTFNMMSQLGPSTWRKVGG
jgi:hypothetical protein